MFKNWFKTLKEGKIDLASSEQLICEVRQSFDADAGSEFMSCAKGARLQVISKLPDKTVIVKSPKTSQRRLVPAFVFVDFKEELDEPIVETAPSGKNAVRAVVVDDDQPTYDQMNHSPTAPVRVGSQPTYGNDPQPTYGIDSQPTYGNDSQPTYGNVADEPARAAPPSAVYGDGDAANVQPTYGNLDDVETSVPAAPEQEVYQAMDDPPESLYGEVADPVPVSVSVPADDGIYGNDNDAVYGNADGETEALYGNADEPSVQTIPTYG